MIPLHLGKAGKPGLYLTVNECVAVSCKNTRLKYLPATPGSPLVIDILFEKFEKWQKKQGIICNLFHLHCHVEKLKKDFCIQGKHHTSFCNVCLLLKSNTSFIEHFLCMKP